MYIPKDPPPIPPQFIVNSQPSSSPVTRECLFDVYQKCGCYDGKSVWEEGLESLMRRSIFSYVSSCSYPFSDGGCEGSNQADELKQKRMNKQSCASWNMTCQKNPPLAPPPEKKKKKPSCLFKQTFSDQQ